LLENFMQLRSSLLISEPDKFQGSSDMLLKTHTTQPRREGSPGNRSFKQFLRSRDGGVAVFGVFMMPVLAGFVGMGLDMSVWYAMKRDVQGIADAAAIGAAQTQFQGGEASAVQASALADAQLNGYSVGSGNSLTVTEVNTVSGALTETVQVTARLRAPMQFAGFFLDDIFVSAFATAGFEQVGEQCILALDESADKALDFGGTATVTVGCGVHSNSDSPSSISVSGNATLVANPATAHGGIDVKGSGQIVSDFPWMPYSPSVTNPYENMAMPSKPAGCDYTGHSVEPSETVTFDATASGGSMRFCDGLDLKGDVTFTAGTYFIDEGTFQINSQAVVDASAGVSFVLTGDTPDDVANIRINGGAEVTINAPSVASGSPLAGMAIVQDPSASTATTKSTAVAPKASTGSSISPATRSIFSVGPTRSTAVFRSWPSRSSFPATRTSTTIPTFVIWLGSPAAPAAASR
jgi:hypothetical protein